MRASLRVAVAADDARGKTTPLMEKMLLDEFAAKLKCASCGQTDFYARQYI